MLREFQKSQKLVQLLSLGGVPRKVPETLEVLESCKKKNSTFQKDSEVPESGCVSESSVAAAITSESSEALEYCKVSESSEVLESSKFSKVGEASSTTLRAPAHSRRRGLATTEAENEMEIESDSQKSTGAEGVLESSEGF